MTMKVKPKEPRVSGNETTTPERVVKKAHLKYDEQGRELMDPTPIAPPIGYKKSPSITETIRNMIRSEHLRREAESQGYESFEEADDFEMAEDPDPKSPYEEQFEPVPQDDGSGKLKELGDYIGERIISSLGGDASSPAPTAPEGAEKPPAASRQRAAPSASTPSPAPGHVPDAALARGTPKPQGKT